MDNEPTEELITIVMLKTFDAAQEENEKGIFNCYTPANIYIKNFNITNLETMFIKFGAPIINKKNHKDGCYISPDVHQGKPPSSKAVIFSLGLIWDEIFHHTPYYSSIADIKDPESIFFLILVKYDVRNQNINPIIKNLLADMLIRDPDERLGWAEARKRVSLQKYVTGASSKK